ncbi:MAG: glutamine amidotransferase [Gemmataceae bacterium]|nr:glutamine amidotransferase [Gemmataceae bacterium]
MIPEMFFAALTVSVPGSLLPAALVVLAGLALLVWGYRGTTMRPGERFICGALKLLGVAALAACLIEPLWTGQRVKPGANYFAILADNSQGMCVKDARADLPRNELLAQMLASERSTWQRSLEEFFQVRRYQFDSRLQPARDFSGLTFEGRASNLGGSLRSIIDRFRGQPLAGVLLFTDGNATDSAGRIDLAGAPPIFPVVLGADGPSHDIAIANVGVNQTAFEDAPVTIQADVSAFGYSKDVTAQVLQINPSAPPDADETLVAEQHQLARGSGQLSFRFQVRPERSGISFYRVRAFARGTADQFKNPRETDEATLANNSRIAAVDRGGGPYRILYVSGRPNWEFKFLRRSLEEDNQLDLVGLIRIARREPKFEFRGRPGEASNPLFRGFDKKNEETERYDQPVLVRLNTRDELELSGGFPKTAEELFGYHAVIIDDLESQFFTADQLLLLQRFVSERGGGFLMLGGQDSFHEGNYHRTPVGDMLPVYLDQVPDDRPPGPLRLSLTREGWLQPWARLRTTEGQERQRLNELPEFEVLNKVRAIKPGATVAAIASDNRGGQFPALVVQRFGHGRTAAVLLGDLWVSGLAQEEMQRDLGKTWRQTIRWLVADVPQRVELQTEPKGDEGASAIALSVRVRDKQFQPMNNASVTVTVRPVGQSRSAVETNVIRIPAEASATEPGFYEAAYVPRDAGAFLAEAITLDEAGAEIGRADAAWSSDPAAEEFRSLKPNRALLEQLAKSTGGRIIDAADLEKFAARLPREKVPIMETWTTPAWHRASVFLFALACFAAEWGLRRWRGLA